jgi:cytochrome P450
MLEMRLVLAIVLQSLEFSLAPGSLVQPKASLTLRPGGPLNVTVRAVRRPAAIHG